MDAEYGELESFGIDDGELDSLSRQECFVLGFELGDISRLAEDSDEGIERPVHASNAERLREFLNKRQRRYDLTWMKDDVSETWMWLSVELRC